MGSALCGVARELARRPGRQRTYFWRPGLLAMMIVFMPLGGHGPFALSLGPHAVVAMLVLHLVYGAVLGVVYARVAHE